MHCYKLNIIPVLLCTTFQAAPLPPYTSLFHQFAESKLFCCSYLLIVLVSSREGLQ